MPASYHEPLPLPMLPLQPAGHGGILWRAIAASIRMQIDSGAWPLGGQLPTEPVLAAHFGVNRHTVRRALGALGEDGLVVASRGRGTFVAGGVAVALPVRARGDHADALAALVPGVRQTLVARKTAEAGQALATRLGVAPGSPLHHVEVRLVAGDMPVGLIAAWLPAAGLHGFDAAIVATASIMSALARCVVEDPHRGAVAIGVSRADRRVARFLGCEAGHTLLVADSVIVTRDGSRVAAERAQFVSGRLRLSLPPAQMG